MTRKNYPTKTMRRARWPQMPVVFPGFADDVPGTYEITVSNGSGVRVLTMNGTQATIWAWAVQAGRVGRIGPGRWEPQRIRRIGPLPDRAVFAAL